MEAQHSVFPARACPPTTTSPPQVPDARSPFPRAARLTSAAAAAQELAIAQRRNPSPSPPRLPARRPRRLPWHNKRKDSSRWKKNRSDFVSYPSPTSIQSTICLHRQKESRGGLQIESGQSQFEQQGEKRRPPKSMNGDGQTGCPTRSDTVNGSDPIQVRRRPN